MLQSQTTFGHFDIKKKHTNVARCILQAKFGPSFEIPSANKLYATVPKTLFFHQKSQNTTFPHQTRQRHTHLGTTQRETASYKLSWAAAEQPRPKSKGRRNMPSQHIKHMATQLVNFMAA